MKTRLEIISKEGKLLEEVIIKKTPEGYLETKGIVYCTKSPEVLMQIINEKIARCPPIGYEEAEVLIQEPKEQYH